MSLAIRQSEHKQLCSVSIKYQKSNWCCKKQNRAIVFFAEASLLQQEKITCFVEQFKSFDILRLVQAVQERLKDQPTIPARDFTTMILEAGAFSNNHQLALQCASILGRAIN